MDGFVPAVFFAGDPDGWERGLVCFFGRGGKGGEGGRGEGRKGDRKKDGN